jgi:arylsulfatase A-like enzyme
MSVANRASAANIVWIVVDCLRPDHLGCYGYGRATSPHVDRFARDCVRFEQCISPHIPTHPSHTTLFSGRDVFAHQIVAQGGTKELDPSIRLLPALLRERGYFTGAVDNIGRWIEPAFERYEPYPRWDHDGSRPWRNGEQVTERALALLNAAHGDGRPFFLFFHYWDPHTPYIPPPPFSRLFYEGDERDPAHRRTSHSMDPVWRSPWFANYFAEWLDGVTDRRFPAAQYDASIAYTDACLEHVFQRLAELDRLRDTLVVLTADHGEELDEHGCWFDHHGLYETNVRVPLLLRFPDGRGAGRAVPNLVSGLDVTPTLLDALGLPEIAAEQEMPGRNLAPLALGRAVPALDALYLTECTWMRKRGWRTPHWKLIRALEPDIYGTPPVELYDLRADPGERANVASARPDVVEALSGAMDAWVARRLAETGLPDPSVEQADALRTWQPRFSAGRRP